VHERIDRMIDSLSPTELAELRESLMQGFPAALRARLLSRPVDPRGSDLVRGHFRTLVIEEMKNEQPDTVSHRGAV
jgi:hypothetical protein